MKLTVLMMLVALEFTTDSRYMNTQWRSFPPNSTTDQSQYVCRKIPKLSNYIMSWDLTINAKEDGLNLISATRSQVACRLESLPSSTVCSPEITLDGSVFDGVTAEPIKGVFLFKSPSTELSKSKNYSFPYHLSDNEDLFLIAQVSNNDSLPTKPITCVASVDFRIGLE